VVAALVIVFKQFSGDTYNVSVPFRSDEFGLSMLYPRSWEAFTELPEDLQGQPDMEWADDMVVMFRSTEPSPFNRGVVVSVWEPEDEPKTDEDIATLYQGFLDELGFETKLVEYGRVSINGHEAVRTVYKVRVHLPDERRAWVQYLNYTFYFDDHVFDVRCLVPVFEYESHVEVLEKICSSFRRDAMG
jgi:hypothetical protein